MSTATSTAFSEDILTIIWGHVTMQVSNFTKVVAIPAALVHLLSPEAKEILGAHFMDYIQNDAMIVQDASDMGRYFLGPSSAFSSNNLTLKSIPGLEYPVLTIINQSKTEPETTTKPVQKLPRPPNAYILYRKDRHQIIKDANPGITNNEISRILGKQWKAEDPSIRTFYKQRAEEYKRRFMELHPYYQYRPRKAGEKKRRIKRTPKEPSTGTTAKPKGFDIENLPNPFSFDIDVPPAPTGSDSGDFNFDEFMDLL